jgi:hypothetical protein
VLESERAATEGRPYSCYLRAKSKMTFLPRRIIEFDSVEATVGVALRGHPLDEAPVQ